MKLLARHSVLATGGSSEDARAQVLHFFKATSLVNYDKIIIPTEGMTPATDPVFNERLEQGLRRNREILDRFLDELSAAQPTPELDIANLPQGYPSKIFHIIAHFLDGFIGIDSAFYNLVDDSHWLPDKSRDRIGTEPEKFWLFQLECYSMSPREAALLHM
jgi:hypothetical protein